MRRAACWAGFSYLIVMAAASFLSRELCFALAAVMLLGLVTAVLVLRGRGKELCVALGAAAAAFAVMGAYLGAAYYPQLALDGCTARIAGRVSGTASVGGQEKLTVRTDSVDIEGAPQETTMVIQGYGEYGARVGDTIDCTVRLTAVGEETALEDRLFLRSGGVALYGYILDTPKLGVPTAYPLSYYIYLGRGRLTEGIKDLLPDWRGEVLAAMLTGERSGLDSDIRSSYRAAGLSHMLAISGLHMTAVTGALERFMYAVNMKRRRRGVWLAVTTAVYMCVAGAGISVLRSGFMLITRYIGAAFGKKDDPLNSLAVAVLIVTLANPLSACDPGFLMSVLGSLAIITLSAPLSLWLESRTGAKEPGRVLGWFIQTFSVSVCAWCCTSPVAALAFGSLSLTAVPANTAGGFFAQMAVELGMPAMLLSALGLRAAAMPFGMAAGLCESALLGIAKFFAALPFATVSFSQSWMKVWLAGTVALVVLPPALKKGWAYLKYSAVLAAIALMTGIISYSVLMRGVTVLEVQPLAEGTAVVCSSGGSSVLITEGMEYDDAYDVKTALERAGGGVSAFVSLGGDPAAELKIEKEYKPEAAVLSAPAAERTPGAFEAGDGVLTFWGGAQATFSANGAYAVETGGIAILYIYGECDIMELPARFRRADIVVLAGKEPENMGALGCRYLLTRGRRAPFEGADETILISGDGTRVLIRGKNVTRGRWA